MPPPLFLPPALPLPSLTFRQSIQPLYSVRRLSSRVPIDPQPSPGDKIFIALSSGVDSTVAASILLQSHPARNLFPIYLQNWTPSQHPPSTAPKLGPYGKPQPQQQQPQKHQQQKCVDAEFARVKQICRHLALPNEPLLLSFEKEYWFDVFIPMLSTYSSGATPNPDVACNRAIKFGVLAHRLEALAGERQKWWLATGHYARVSGGRLMRSADRRKDQTYFLSTIPVGVLTHCLFPLGDEGLVKTEVKARARKLAAPGWREGEDTNESFGLCFVEPSGGRNSGFRRFLGEYLPPSPGEVVVGASRTLWPNGEEVAMPPQGTVVGKHEGLWHATIGEKAHLQPPQASKEFQGRWYVSRKETKTNRIEVVKDGNNRALFSKAMVVAEWRWLGDDAQRVAEQSKRAEEGTGMQDGPWERGLVTQFRHLQTPLRVAEMKMLGKERIRIVFETPQKAVTVGQSAALWDGEWCLGGGVIEEAEGI